MDKDLLGILNKIAGLWGTVRKKGTGIRGLARRWVAIAMMAILFLVAASPGVFAEDRDARRAWVALDVFPSLVAADQDILAKTAPDGNLVLLILYVDDKALAADMAAHLAKVGNIRGTGVHVEIGVVGALEKFLESPLAGLFIAQKLGGELNDAVRFGTEKGCVVFSPFEEDMERGAHAGILISDRVVPFVNMTAMRESKIRIKPFFLRIAEIYE